MLEGLPVFPAHEIIVAEVLIKELDAALAADLKNNSGIGPGHVRIACLLGEKIRIWICISLLKIDVRHADTGTKKTDRLIEVGLGDCPEFCLCLSEVEVYLGCAEERKVIVGSSIEVYAKVNTLHVLGRLITGL